MKMKRNKYIAVAFATVAMLTACGGSSDDGAGQLSTFQVSPDEVKWETTATTCDLIKTGEYAIIGGTAPYVVYSPYDPDPADPNSLGVTFSAPGGTAPTHAGTYTVPNRNGRFAIYIQGCFDPATVTVLDDLKRVATIKVSYKASGVN
ncbi:MAG: hypothetical protein KF891_15385 [Rhizobacter sp.]|nr:hypothetical protein [Rhizobacter sp.]